MKKINQEEYKFLKNLDDKWKWITRNRDERLYAFQEPPEKVDNFRWNNMKHPWLGVYGSRFSFIQWEDESPYSISELIEKYEFYDYIGWEHHERKKSEVKDISWLNNELEKVIKDVESDNTSFAGKKDYGEGYIDGIRDVQSIVNQLDKTEVLSQEWIEEHRESTFDLDEDFETVFVRVRNLQNLLAPKQELPVIPRFVAEWIEENKKKNRSLVFAITHIYDENEIGKSPKFFIWMESDDNEEVFARAWLDGYTVEEEQKYILSISITDKASKTNYETFLNKRGIFHSMENESFNSEEFNWTEEEIKDMENGEILFEHFATKIGELE